MQMLAANHTPNERSSDNCNSNNNCNNNNSSKNNNWGNNCQLRVAQSLEAERQLSAYTQLAILPRTWHQMANKEQLHQATQPNCGPRRRSCRRRERTEINPQELEPHKAHGRASWALKSPRCDEATYWLNESVSKMRWMQQQGNCNWLGLRLGLGWALERALILLKLSTIAIAIDISALGLLHAK